MHDPEPEATTSGNNATADQEPGIVLDDGVAADLAVSEHGSVSSHEKDKDDEMDDSSPQSEVTAEPVDLTKGRDVQPMDDIQGKSVKRTRESEDESDYITPNKPAKKSTHVVDPIDTENQFAALFTQELGPLVVDVD